MEEKHINTSKPYCGFEIKEVIVPATAPTNITFNVNPKKRRGPKPPTIIKISDDVKARHRENFNQLNFQGLLDQKPKGSKHVTSAELARMVRIMRLWSTDKASLTKDEKKLDTR